MTDNDTWLRELVNDGIPHPPRAVDFDKVAARAVANASTPRVRHVVLVLATSVAVALVALAIAAVRQDSRVGNSALSHGSHSPGSSSSIMSQRPGATTKLITYRGVQVAVPSTWPVIDGAHSFNECSSVFAGQSDRAFLGPTYKGWPRNCKGTPKPPPPADGVWLQPGGPDPRGRAASVLPNGQRAYVSTERSSVRVWFHHVLIYIGIGRDHKLERAIAASMQFVPTTADTTARGQCPTPDSIPLAMPEPTRLDLPRSIPGDQGHLFPAPSVVPKVSAAAVWHSFVQQSAGGPRGPIAWSITFGRYSATTTTEVTRDGTTRPVFRAMPSWLVVGLPASSDMGPCTGTSAAIFDADNGRLVISTAGG